MRQYKLGSRYYRALPEAFLAALRTGETLYACDGAMVAPWSERELERLLGYGKAVSRLERAKRQLRLGEVTPELAIPTLKGRV